MKLNYQHFEEATEFKSTKDQIERLLLDEKVYWKQRSRADWLKEGDKNTKYFHLKASSREKKNWIGGILNQEEGWTEDKDEIEKEFMNTLQSCLHLQIQQRYKLKQFWKA